MINYERRRPRVVGYARVSSEEQREGQTIDSQIHELVQFSRGREWVITKVYTDNGWSGSTLARPGLDQLRDNARFGRIDIVLINDVDRLARDVAHLGILKRDLERQNVKVMFRKLPAEGGPMADLMVNILGSFAEFERSLIMDRTRRGHRYKVEHRKQYLGCNTAYGYRYLRMNRINGTPGLLEVEPAEAEVVRQMFNWVGIEGLSAGKVVNRLNERGVRTRKGGSWRKSTVLLILHNEMYSGVWHYNKNECCIPKRRVRTAPYHRRVKSSARRRNRSDWIPLMLPEPLRLVTRQRWKLVQLQLRRNQVFSPRNEKHPYLLKGLITCSGCGLRYVGEPSHGRFYYRCSGRCGKVPAVREYLMENLALKALRNACPGQGDLQAIPREQLRDHLQRSIERAVYDGSRITICLYPNDDSSFPDLESTDAVLG